MEKHIGAYITKGPMPFQIFQQENGFAQIELSGTVVMNDEMRTSNPKVVVHLLDEDSGYDVIPSVSVDIKDDKWEAKLIAPKGGMYTIRTFIRLNIRDEYRGDIIHHIGVGDLYLIAGQSNAEGNGRRAIHDPVSPYVHAFKLNGKWDIATHPLADNTDSKYQRYKGNLFHSPWLNFAKIINKNVGYPIGLIASSQGGVPLSFYDRAENGELLDDTVDIVKNAGGKIKGILWYQGCADLFDKQQRETYLERFIRVCKDMRAALNCEAPIITVQLNKGLYYGDRNHEELTDNWSQLREAQRKAPKKIENVYVVPSIDLEVCDTIHNTPYSNMVIGERVAMVALKYIYGTQTPCEAPNINKAVLTSGNTVELYFDNVYDAIATDFRDVGFLNFTVDDKDGRAFLESYECTGDNRIVLKFERDITLPAKIGCNKPTEAGFMPYDYATRLPALAFCDFEITK